MANPYLPLWEYIPDGTIHEVEITFLGFEDALDPYNITNADTACVLKNGCIITEFDKFTRIITNITSGCVICWKYYDFGQDFTDGGMELELKVIPRGCHGKIHVIIDNYTDGEEICTIWFDRSSNVLHEITKTVTGRHAIFFAVEDGYMGWSKESFNCRQLFDLIAFVFLK